jgi:hypothetical protein
MRATLPRPPHPAPNVRDDAYAPLEERGTERMMRLIWGFNQAEYFSRKDWTTQISLRRQEKLDFWRSGILRSDEG